MFGGRRNDVGALFRVHLGHALDGEIIGFSGTAGEDDFLGAGTDQAGDLLAGIFDALFGYPAKFVVPTGGIAEALGEVGKHGFHDAGVNPCGCVIVEVDR